ncbi:MAG: hypothetical protein ACXVA4_11255, partial [Ktedonobacterales bacterium]
LSVSFPSLEVEPVNETGVPKTSVPPLSFPPPPPQADKAAGISNANSATRGNSQRVRGVTEPGKDDD